VIPALIRKCVEARRAGADHIVAWGTGAASREFLYVDDCAEAIVLATLNYDAGDPVNLGAGREITVRALTELVVRLCRFEGQIVWDPTKPRRCLDVSRARERFGFTAQMPFEEGLKRTIAWYEEVGMAKHDGR
jgi:GDP-L-fucose synthase